MENHQREDLAKFGYRLDMKESFFILSNCWNQVGGGGGGGFVF